MDHRSIILISGVLLLLMGATAAVESLRRRKTGVDASVLDVCRTRLRAWWTLFGSLICVLLIGTFATVFLFWLVSFWALREYITLTPTRPADHKTLFGVFFILAPLQFILVGLDSEWFRQTFGVGTYSVYSVLLPAYAFLILPASVAVSGDPKRFLERIAKIQVGLLICVYSLSYAPAILTTPLARSTTSPVAPDVYAVGLEDKLMTPIEKALTPTNVEPVDRSVVSPSNVAEPVKTPRKILTSDNLRLLFVFVTLVQLSDIFQYFWQLVFQKHKIAPTISSSKTYEGVFLGALSTALTAVALWGFTPFEFWWQPAVLGFVVSLMGFAGSITMSAIKRDRGVKNYGVLVEGRNGVLDRVDSLCFAAPVFFHLVWIFLNV